jgi:hypothetical protein
MRDSVVQANEVVERYVYFAEDNEEIWHLVFKHVELKPGRREVMRLVTVVEETQVNSNMDQFR